MFILKEDFNFGQVIQPNTIYKLHFYSNFEVDSIYINSISSEQFTNVCKKAIFNPLLSFSFEDVSETLYFSFVCQNLCVVVEIDDQKKLQNFFNSLEEITLVPSRKKDLTFLKKFGQNPKFSFLDENEFLNSRSDSKTLKMKYHLINRLTFGESLTIGRYLFLSSLALFNFFLRRNYFPTKSFIDSSFLFPPIENQPSLKDDQSNQAKIPKLNDSDFLKIRVIGYGFNSVITLAVQKTTGFVYAIKTMTNKKCYKAEYKCFEKNINTRLVHCYGIVSQGANKAFVLDFMCNGNLEDRQITDPTIKSQIIYQILFSLDCLHSNDLIHCDIKPSSILLNRDYDAYITGFSRVHEYVSNDKRTINIGTFPYMAPEIVKGSDKYSFQSDLFSFGILIYEFATGRELYDKLTILEAFRRGAKGEVDKIPISEGSIQKIYNLCISENENERPTSFILRKIFEKESLFFSNTDEEKIFNFIEKEKLDQLKKDNDEENKKEILVNSNERSDFIYILNEAKNGNPSSQYYLGILYSNGWIIEKNDKLAFEWFSKAADQNHPLALFELALFYHKKAEKIEIKNDYQKAFEIYTKSAEQGVSDALNGIGELYLDDLIKSDDETDNIKEAFKYFKQAADVGNHYSQYHLGELFISGKLDSTNVEKSLEYLNLSVSQCNPEAEFLLGSIYSEGKLVPRDEIQAAKLYKKAAFHNNIKAMKEYGKILIEGKGVTINKIEGEKWIQNAIALENNE